MIELIIGGIGLGLLLALLIGPVFFTLIQTSIEFGFKSAVYLSLGVLNSDIFYIILSYMGLSRFISDNMQIFSLVGGIIFLIFGFVSILNSGKVTRTKLAFASNVSPVKIYIKGFIINALSPFVPLFWIASVGTISTSGSNSVEILIFFAIALITVFITDLIKAKSADYLSKYITNRFTKILKIVAGIVFIIAAIRILLIEY